MYLLVYGNRKEDDLIWDISTADKKSAAFLSLFQKLRDDWQVYKGMDPDVKQIDLYAAADKGDAQAAERLLVLRRDYEYEEWHIAETEN